MGYIVHGILQARILKQVAVSFSRGSSQPKGRTQVSGIVGGFVTSLATRRPYAKFLSLFYLNYQIELLLIAITSSSVSTIIDILFLDMLSYLVTQYFDTI